MMRKNRLVFKIEGPDKNNNHLELSVFLEKTRQFLGLLKNSAKDSGEDGVVFHVVSLSHSSPATIECEPIGPDTHPSIVAFNSVRENLDLATKGQARQLSNPVLSTMEKLVQLNPKKITGAEIQTISSDTESKCVYKLDARFNESLIKARSEEEMVVSTIDGKLKQINIHQNANTFKIYPTFPCASSVTCKFSKELIKDVQSALGKFVSVWGECSYRPAENTPYKINVRKMKVLPPSEELPSLWDLCGIAPGATGGKSSEQFVREQRDEWS